jgi:hypothetical protein
MQFVYSNKVAERQNIAKALRYLPEDILTWVSDNVVYFTTYGKKYGSRLSRGICQTKEIIIISEKTFPRQFDETALASRFFIFIVLHETAHAWLQHKCRVCDKISDDECQKQEDEATALALGWYNDYALTHSISQLEEDHIEKFHSELDRTVDEWEETWNHHLEYVERQKLTQQPLNSSRHT